MPKARHRFTAVGIDGNLHQENVVRSVKLLSTIIFLQLSTTASFPTYCYADREGSHAWCSPEGVCKNNEAIKQRAIRQKDANVCDEITDPIAITDFGESAQDQRQKC